MQGFSSQIESLSPEVVGDCYTVWAHPDHGTVQLFQEAAQLAPELSLEIGLGYRRYLEFDKEQAAGQDAAALRYDKSYLVAVVADGVSQSFFGDLAAIHVSRWLLRELWSRRAEPPGIPEMKRRLAHEETILAGVVERYPLEGIEPPLLREALQGTKKLGSQTVFSALIWDLSSRAATLYQVGNVLGVFYFPGKDLELLRGTNGRWSSAQKSNLQLSQVEIENCSGFVLCSDGVCKGWGEEGLRGITQEAFCQMVDSRAAEDDVSFVSAFIMCNGTEHEATIRGNGVELRSSRRPMNRQSPSRAEGISTTASVPTMKPVSASAAVSKQNNTEYSLGSVPNRQARNSITEAPTEDYRQGPLFRLEEAKWRPVKDYLSIFLRGTVFGFVVAGFVFFYLLATGRINFEPSRSHPQPLANTTRASTANSGTDKPFMEPPPSTNERSAPSSPAGVQTPSGSESAAQSVVKYDKATISLSPSDPAHFKAGLGTSIPQPVQDALASPNHGIVLKVSFPPQQVQRVTLKAGSETLFDHAVEATERVIVDGDPTYPTNERDILDVELYGPDSKLIAVKKFRPTPGTKCYEVEFRPR